MNHPNSEEYTAQHIQTEIAQEHCGFYKDSGKRYDKFMVRMIPERAILM